MITDELTAIEQRAEAATAGPWHAAVDYDGDGMVLDSGGYLIAETAQWLSDQSEAEFIASCRTDVPALCREVRRLTAENDELRKRPTLEQATESILPEITRLFWGPFDVLGCVDRAIRQLYAEEQPHD